MAELRILVVGYGTAGSAAAGYARRVCRKCSVVVVEKRRYAVYHPCSIPRAIAGHVSFSSLAEEEPLTAGVEMVLGRGVVDLGGGEAVLDDGSRIRYDRLVLATGSRPLVPRSLRGALELEGVYTIRGVEDGAAVRRRALSSRRAVVVGGGAIGLEVAVALRELGLETTVYEMMSHVLPGALDGGMAGLVERYLAGLGIEVLLESPVEAVEPRGGGLRVLGGGSERQADLVVLAMGTRPDTGLAEKLGLRLGPRGGVLVDERMETSEPGVYAAGDIAEVRDLVAGGTTLAMLASPAFRQGRVAGTNAAGGDARYRGTAKPWLVDLHGASVGGVGLSAEAAQRAGLSPVSARVQSPDKPHYMPGSRRVSVKLVAARDTGRLLGAQVFAEAGVVGLVDVAAAMVSMGATVWDLLDLENAYMPVYSEVYTPLYAAADALARRLGKR